MEGFHRQMDDVWFPDRAITFHQLMAVLTLLEEDWNVWQGSPTHRLQIALMAAALVIGYAAALRGEEIPRADLANLRKNWKEGLAHPTAPHVPIALIGRFKNEGGNKSHTVPLACQTSSGLPVKKWVERAIGLYELLGIVDGPLFRVQTKTSFRRAKVRDLDPRFHDLLKRVQYRWPHLLSPNLDPAAEFSLSRSLRRGATTQARIVNIPEEIITANNRWRIEDNAKGKTPSWAMFDRYSDVSANAELLVKFSILL